jgi:peroxin-1
VLLNADTEVYVAPRPRGSKSKVEPRVVSSSKTTAEADSSSSSKKEKSVKARLIPGAVAAAWGTLTDSEEVTGRVMLCAEDVVERARRKFAADGPHVFVKARLGQSNGHVKEETAENPPQDEGSAEDGPDVKGEDTDVESWLVPWEEMPDGCVVLTGKIQKGWEGWSTIR